MVDVAIQKAAVLIEAIPYIHAFRRKIFVIKYGGSILEQDDVRRRVFKDIVFLSYVGIRVILVHGGGPHISARLKSLGIEARFHKGIRVTDEQTIRVVVEELDKLNHAIVEEIRELKGDVTGLKGYENILHVERKKAETDLGFVGTIQSVEKKIIAQHLHQGHITVISPLGIREGQPYNINADEVAAAIAASLNAEKLVMLTDVKGVLADPSNPNSLISTLTPSEIRTMLEGGVIGSGMIPKVTACLEALAMGVKKTHIVDARLPHALLLEFFTDEGIGTQILPDGHEGAS